MFHYCLKKRGQLTLFLILGILIVVGITAFFMILPSPETGRSPKQNPTETIKQCISDEVRNVLPKIQEQGGYENPADYLTYEGKKVAYHCYTSARKEICLRNNALSKTRMEEEIRSVAYAKVEECFNSWNKGMAGYNVESSPMEFSIVILPGKILVKVKKEMTISRGGTDEPERYSQFDSSINSPLFDFMAIANEILNQEVSCNCPEESCIADVTGIMKDNQDYQINFYVGGSSDRVYTLKDYYEQNIFKFAVKNCNKNP